jgi:REP element-mobilizing transposase RayT
LVTRRCTQRQFLLRPDDETNNAFIYCLGYAAEKTGIDIIAAIANTNHYHAVVIDNDARIPEFLEIFHKLMAKHQNVLRGRSENMWASEQTSLVELVGQEDIVAKVVYTLTNPVKDHLVERAHEWPGATSLQANLEGKALHASRPNHFFRRRGEMPKAVDVSLAPIPGFDVAGQERFRRDLKELIAQVEAEAAAERKRTGRRVLGREAILKQDPFARPTSDEPRRELNPRVAAQDKGARAEAIQAIKTFRSDYTVRRIEWLNGKDVLFPLGTYWLRRFAGARCEEVRRLAA